MNGEASRCPALAAGDPDLTDPATYRDADYFAQWRRARREHPVVRLDSPRFGAFWSVTAHAAAREVLERPESFTSTRGMRLGGEAGAVSAASGGMLVVSDGPAHARLRSAHAPWFAGRAVARLKDTLRSRLDAKLAELADGTPVDVVARLSRSLPTWLVCGMLGVPEEDWEELAALAAAAFDETETSTAAARRAASAGVFAYFAELLDRRRPDPGDDLVSALLQQSGADRLTDEEILLNCDGLVNGGLGTTRHAVSGAVLAFAAHPREWRRLRADPRSVPTAVEEILRWASPPLHMMRTATEDVRLGDALIRAGERVVLWIPSCNRDESVFAEPDAFRIDRRPNPHLSLGGGPHYCIGASLARLELRTLLEALLTHVARIEFDGTLVRTPSTFLHGLDRLEVTLMPAAAVPGSPGGE
ncbi:cytochrome P450 [Streptomyces sp. NPDC051677]|uniref:cytochrome P450 n=1 Tax=Streptomyces sp. NPDC051677 TaxID=3365669 RepID=UPI0037D17F69